MDVTIELDADGVLTLPAAVRQKYGMRPGDTLRLVDLEGILVLTPLLPMVTRLARQIEQARLAAGLSMEELFAQLQEERERYYQEHYVPEQRA